MSEMNVIHLTRGSSRVETPFRPVVAGKDFPFMRIESFADAFCELWKDTDVIVLDALFSPDGAPEDSFGGITLLKLIRMKGLRQHAVVYSPFPLSYLLRWGHNEILLSEGTSYEWLPERIDESVCRERAGRPAEEDLSAYFLPEYNGLLRMERHSLANWWGVLRLFHAMDALGLVPADGRDPGLEEALSREGSYPGRLMRYVRFRGREPETGFSPQAADRLITRLATLRRKDPKVVYVDDQASDGWSCLLQLLIYGRERPERFAVPAIPPPGEGLEALSEAVRAESPDFVILDMRLAPGEPEPSGLDLLRLLSKPGHEIGCPVLAFTASDKRTVSDRALSIGADAVWTKEGIDESERLSPMEYGAFTTERFVSLVTIMEGFLLRERRTLYEFLRAVNELDSAPDPYWWEKERWYPGDDYVHSPVPREAVVGRLRNVYASYKLSLTSMSEVPDEKVYSKLAMELCWILEAVHSAPKDDADPVNAATDVYWPEGSEAVRLARTLVRMRNDVAHSRSFEGGRYGPEDFERVVDRLMRYLAMDTSRTVGEKILVGGLFRDADSPGGFCLRTENGRYCFGKRDEGECGKLYGNPLRERGVAATLRPPISFYDFFSFTLTRERPVRSDLWTMGVRPIMVTGYTVLLDSSAVYPREDVLFRVEGPFPEGVREGDIIRFHLFCADDRKGTSDLRVFQVGGFVPDAEGKNSWSGKVKRVIPADDGIRVGFAVLFPPRRWSFRIPRVQWDEEDGTARWAGFLPDWRQYPCVSRPRLVDGEKDSV